MFYLDYDLPQLVKIAENKIREFDEERLTTPKSLDALDFLEFDNGLGRKVDPQRLTPTARATRYTRSYRRIGKQRR